MKIKIKRKVSGNKIRKQKRIEEFHSAALTNMQRYNEVVPPERRKSIEYFYQTDRYEGKNLYSKYQKISNKEHKENPSLYGEESPYSNYLLNPRIRKPKKARKTAWKRFFKLYPNLDPNNKKEEDGSNQIHRTDSTGTNRIQRKKRYCHSNNKTR